VKEVYVKKPVHHYESHDEHYDHGSSSGGYGGSSSGYGGSSGSHGGSSSGYGGSSSSYIGGGGDDSYDGKIIIIITYFKLRLHIHLFYNHPPYLDLDLIIGSYIKLNTYTM
jgi:hypothetical protein